MNTVSIKFNNSHSQNCLVPQHLLKNSVLKPGDIVSIHCGSRFFICRIFISSADLEKSVIINDAVWYNSYTEQITERTDRKQLFFPADFSVLKMTTYQQLKIKLIIQDEQFYFQQNPHHYQNIALSILQKLVICEGATVNCSSLEVAGMFSIHSIIITEAYPKEHTCGRLSRTSSITISEVLFEKLSNPLRNIEVGGIDNEKRLLSFYLFQKAYKRVIVTGPSGCGKSLLVKKFCHDLNCSLVTIDGMTRFNLTTETCDAYCKYLRRMVPDNLSFLFIDHLDKLASSESKGKVYNSVSILVKLLKKLEHSNVYVVATAVQKNLIHPALACLFEEMCLEIPTTEQRKEILKVSLKSVDSSQTNFDEVAAMLPGFIASDIKQLADNVIKRKETAYSSNDLQTSDHTTSTKDFEQALLSFTPSILKSSDWNLKVLPVRWSDIGGLVKIKERLQMCIEKPLLHPELFEKVGLCCPTGVLLFGPPGCCKTTLARGLATECNANFFAANPSQIYSAFVGESEKNISQLFYQARLCAPSIIFLDELDSLVGYRDLNTKQQGVAEKVLSTLLNEMDGASIKTGLETNNSDILKNTTENGNGVLEKNMKNEVIVVAATNRPDCIDNALLRPGRFDVILYVPPPNYEERISILQTITKGIPLQEVDLKEIAENTEFFTGADLKNLYNMVAMNALRQDINAEYITQDHFMQAFKSIQPSITKEQVLMYEQLSTKYGPVISE